MADARSKQQGSDYYIGVYDTSKDKCYLVPVHSALQMTQKISGFQEKYGASQDNEDRVKNMTYYDQK